MLKLTQWNLPEKVSNDDFEELLSRYVPEGVIVGMHIVSDNDPKHAMAIIDLHLDSFASGELALELDGRWHAGSFLRAHVLNHA